MEAKLSIHPEILALRKDLLPRRKPIRVRGQLGIAALDVEVNQKKDRATAPEVKETIAGMRKQFIEIATALKAIEDVKAELKDMAVEETVPI